MVETLDGLWDRSDERYDEGIYGGIRLKSPAPTPHLLPPIYTRIQVSFQKYIFFLFIIGLINHI